MEKNLLKIFIVMSSIILVSFLVSILLFNEVIILRGYPFLERMDRGQEYWSWYLENSNINSENKLTDLFLWGNELAKPLMFLILVYIIINDKYRRFLSGKKLLFTIAILALIYFIQYYITFNLIYHNKLYMEFIPTSILAIGILFLSMSIFRKSKGNKF